jgi:hypothetical protein
MMKPSILSFLDEMQKIASPALKKEAGMMRNVGAWALHQKKDIGWAAKRMASPVEGFKHGAKFLKKDFSKASPFWKAVTAYGLVSEAPQAFAKEDPTGANRSRTNRLTRFAGSQVGNIIGAPYGMVGGTLAGMVGEGVGSVAGNAIDRVRGIKHKRPTTAVATPSPLQMVAPKVG